MAVPTKEEFANLKQVLSAPDEMELRRELESLTPEAPHAGAAADQITVDELSPPGEVGQSTILGV
jgi:hypothetical protein